MREKNENQQNWKIPEKIVEKLNWSKEKGKKGLFRMVFSRSFIICILLLIQVLILFAVVFKLSDYYLYINYAFVALSILLVIFIINKNDNPMYLIAWIIPILALPVFGCLLYLFVQLQVQGKLMNYKLSILIDDTKKYLKQDRDVDAYLEEQEPQTASLAKYLSNYGGYPMDTNTSVTFFRLGEEKFQRMKEEIKKAKHFIFLEYFIVEAGVMWDSILALLIEKVEEGVEVRMMYDGMCSFVLLPYNYAKKLKSVGIKAKTFSQIKPALSTYQNNRDHRKILVIDGKVAFTGGINLADEYINKKERFGHWKDTAVMLQGPGVRNFTVMFLQMWNISEKKSEDFSKYVNVSQESTKKKELPFVPHNGFVCGYGDNPLDKEDVGEQVYLHMICNATKSIHIMTPYLILGHELQQEIEFAAKRGVDVKLILPHIPDKKYAFVLAKTYFKDLISAGVEIYEYLPGFVHAKEVIADAKSAVVGTINLDFRSLFLHFECAAFIHKNPVIADIETDFFDTLKKSHKVTMEDVIKQPLKEKIYGRLLRLFAPLM